MPNPNLVAQPVPARDGSRRWERVIRRTLPGIVRDQPRWRQPLWGLPLAGAVAAALACGGAALAGPVLCTTTLEAPIAGTASGAPAGPVEVTRCGVLQTAPDLMVRRFYSYTAPFARGIDLTHQITDILGIAMGGGDGTKVMGLGFPDQTIVWDGSAVENTAAVMLEDQSDPLPLRTLDLPSVYGGSLSLSGASAGEARPLAAPPASVWTPSRRGLW